METQHYLVTLLTKFITGAVQQFFFIVPHDATTLAPKVSNDLVTLCNNCSGQFLCCCLTTLAALPGTENQIR